MLTFSSSIVTNTNSTKPGPLLYLLYCDAAEAGGQGLTIVFGQDDQQLIVQFDCRIDLRVNLASRLHVFGCATLTGGPRHG